jgi:phosphoglycerate dehydrogenase-like enzyme
MKRLRALYILDESTRPMIYGADEQRDIARHVDLIGPPQTRESIAARAGLLGDADVIFSGWGAPVVDEPFLDAAPNLRVIFYGAGAIGSWATDAIWDRGVRVTSAATANAVPVAEYALSVILFSLKHGWALARQTREGRCFPGRDGAPGCYGSTVGLVSLGVTARKLVELLRPFDLRLIAYDPYVPPAEAAALGVESTSLADVFRRADVVSLHTPLLPETVGLVTGAHLASMKHGATFINTARGSIVRQGHMLDVLARRPDLQAVLDVCDPEPPAADSPLYALPNVVLTPHIAGSVGTECRRMGRYMVEELERYLTGRALKWEVTRTQTDHSSHRPTDGTRTLSGVSGPAIPV